METERTNRVSMTVVILIAVAIGVAVALALQDLIIGVAVGAALIAITTRISRIWSGGGRGSKPQIEDG